MPRHPAVSLFESPDLLRLVRFSAIVCGLLGVMSSAVAQNAPTLSPDRVTFYTDPNFKGEALTVEAGASLENLDRITRTTTPKPWTFAISSVRVEGAAKATVYSASGYAGERLDISQSIPDLYAVKRAGEPGATWDRAIASLVVAGPPRMVITAPAPVVAPPVVSPYGSRPSTVYVVPTPARPPPPVLVREARPRIDRRSAELMVQRAYREVLNRPADPEGLRTYRDRVMYEGWSERQLIEHLQRSSEARGVNADEAIRRAYREVLGRDPDGNGLAHYRSKWRDGWTQGQIRDDLRRSHEGRDNNIRESITRAYKDLLGREPDPAGYANYERLMRERGYTERDIRSAIMAGDEYKQRRGK
jgi:hypothetical protein